MRKAICDLCRKEQGNDFYLSKYHFINENPSKNFKDLDVCSTCRGKFHALSLQLKKGFNKIISSQMDALLIKLKDKGKQNA